MLYVALLEAATIVVLLYAFSGILRSVLRNAARREDALIDRMLHATGNPWNLAPSDEFVQPHSLYDDEGELAMSTQYNRFTPTPEQEP